MIIMYDRNDIGSASSGGAGQRPAPQPVGPVPHHTDRPVQVLVIDDDVTVLGLIEDVLQNESHLAVTALHDSQRALELIGQQNFDIMITDLKMPNVDGLTLVQELLRLGRETLVIVISGYATMEICLEAMRCGAYDFITKPFRMDEFVHILHKAVDQVRLLWHAQALEQQLGATLDHMKRLNEDNAALREQIEKLEEENSAFQQLLQRAGLSMTGYARAPKTSRGIYPRIVEKPVDRVSREMERLAQLEESGAVSHEEAERARRKLQEAGG